MNWFYESTGQQQGPVNEQELDRLIAEGKITPDTLVWREGLADWQPLRIARPSSGPVIPPIPGGEPGEIPPGYVRCTLTGKVIPESEAIFIQGKPYSPEAKPQVLQSLQSGGTLPMASDAERTGPPWENRGEDGVLKAWWNTVSGVLVAPTDTFRQMRRTGGILPPLLFYSLTAYTSGAISSIYSYFFNQFGSRFQPPTGSELAFQPPDPAMILIWSLLLLLILVPLFAFVLSGIVHLCLMLFGGARHGFETTFRTGCYSWGAVSVFMLLPVCGSFIQLIWGIVAMSLGLAAAHETQTGRAVGAVLLPLIICCGILFVFYGFLFAAIYGAAQPG